MGHNDNIRIQLFGPVVVEVDGTALPIGRLQVRRTAAALALRSGSPIIADTLIEEVWQGRDLPANPRAALRVAITRFRKLLEPHHELLMSGGGSYQLACRNDLHDLEECLEKLRTNDDETTLRHAVGLFDRTSGEPLHDLGDTPLFDHARAKCRQVRDELLGHIGAGMARLGEHDRVTSLFLPAHSANPAREDVSIRLATAMSNLGRKSDALSVIETTRAELRDARGLDPSTALKDAEIAILTGGIELSNRRAPSIRRNNADTFVGREAAVEHMLGGQHSVMVLGLAGMGKTTLLQHVMGRLEAEGPSVLTSPVPRSPQKPMAAIGGLVEQVLDHPSAPARNSVAVRSMHQLIPHRVDRPRRSDGPVSRSELLLRCAELLLDHLDRTGATLVLDDCQWLDPGSTHVIEAIVRSGAARFLGAMRPEPTSLAALLNNKDCTVSLLQLEPFSLEDTRQLVDRRGHRSQGDDFVEAIHARSGGTPLFLTMLLDLNEEGAMTDAELPPSILIAVQQQLDELSLRGRMALKYASVIEGAFEPDLLAGLCPRPRVALEEAVQLDLLLDHGDGRFRFPHPLLQEATEQLLPDGLRIAAHDSVGRALEASNAPAARYARHCVMALDIDPRRAVSATLAAAHQAADISDWSGCATYARLALDLGEERSALTTEDRAELLHLVGRSSRHAE